MLNNSKQRRVQCERRLNNTLAGTSILLMLVFAGYFLLELLADLHDDDRLFKKLEFPLLYLCGFLAGAMVTEGVIKFGLKYNSENKGFCTSLKSQGALSFRSVLLSTLSSVVNILGGAKIIKPPKLPIAYLILFALGAVNSWLEVGRHHCQRKSNSSGKVGLLQNKNQPEVKSAIKQAFFQALVNTSFTIFYFVSRSEKLDAKITGHLFCVVCSLLAAGLSGFSIKLQKPHEEVDSCGNLRNEVLTSVIIHSAS